MAKWTCVLAGAQTKRLTGESGIQGWITFGIVCSCGGKEKSQGSLVILAGFVRQVKPTVARRARYPPIPPPRNIQGGVPFT